ncbi:MAG: hypothetical protein GY775_19515, partial [Candidatus Scalindua sp.]|nr:hypothetical protein [Candidatus Scalindua sp.]
MFDQWLKAKNADDFEKIRQVMLIEQFKNCLFTDLRTHLDDKEVSTLNEAAVLSDSYALTHKRNFMKPRHGYGQNDTAGAPQQKSYVTAENKDDKLKQGDNIEKNNQPRNKDRSAADRGSGRYHNTLPKQPVVQCGFCNKMGHTMQECWKLKKKNEANNPVGFISHYKQDNKQNELSKSEKVMEDYKPYLSQGTVSSEDDSSPAPIQILRDTGASQTLLCEGVLPLSEKTATGKSVLLKAVHSGTFRVPLHRINLSSNIVNGPVIVGVSPTLPVKGVSLLLGNDLASGKDILSPIVSDTSEICEDSDVTSEHLFPACVVTRAMSKKQAENNNDSEIDSEDMDHIYNLDNTFFTDLDDMPTRGKSEVTYTEQTAQDAVKTTFSIEQLVEEQQKDP